MSSLSSTSSLLERCNVLSEVLPLHFPRGPPVCCIRAKDKQSKSRKSVFMVVKQDYVRHATPLTLWSNVALTDTKKYIWHRAEN